MSEIKLIKSAKYLAYIKKSIIKITEYINKLIYHSYNLFIFQKK